MKNIEIIRNDGNTISRELDQVVVEQEIVLEISGRIVRLMSSPGNIKELIVGFLKNGGLIEVIGDIKTYSESGNQVKVCLVEEHERDFQAIRTSGCLGMGVQSNIEMTPNEACMEIGAERIIESSERLNSLSETFKKTGGVHASLMVLTSGEEMFAEDIGRHNTLDRLVGKALLNQKEMSGSLIVTTGRISSEMVLKAVANHVGVLISRSAPTDLAVELAHVYKVNLVGFARGKRFNRYVL
jgi:FdhD protein